MTDREPFLQAILEHPDDDGPRLVYADWLEERGDTAHAELIRLQCELARPSGRSERRTALRARERQLLRLPEFQLPGHPSSARSTSQIGQAAKYQRGFFEQPIIVGMPGFDPDQDVPWDKVVSVRLMIVRRLNEPQLNDYLHRHWGRRITSVGFWETTVTDTSLRKVRVSPTLPNLHSFFAFGCRVNLSGLIDLITASTVRGWHSIYIVGNVMNDRDRVVSQIDTPAMVDALVRFGAAPAIGRLKRFRLTVGPIIGPQCIQAILDAPCLTDSIEQFTLSIDADVPEHLRAELRQKFPNARLRD